MLKSFTLLLAILFIDASGVAAFDTVADETSEIPASSSEAKLNYNQFFKNKTVQLAGIAGPAYSTYSRTYFRIEGSGLYFLSKSFAIGAIYSHEAHFLHQSYSIGPAVEFLPIAQEKFYLSYTLGVLKNLSSQDSSRNNYSTSSYYSNYDWSDYQREYGIGEYAPWFIENKVSFQYFIFRDWSLGPTIGARIPLNEKFQSTMFSGNDSYRNYILSLQGQLNVFF